MTSFLLVGAGGFLGALTRYFSSTVIVNTFGPEKFPLATFFVNVLGCFLIGLSITASAKFGSFSSELRLLCVTGFLGSFTTFSAFGLETMFLFKRGEFALAALNVVLSVACGIAALWLGSKF